MNELAKRNGNEPAHPCTDRYDGLTKRELFAAMAMQALLSNPETWHLYKPNHATENADKLLAELNK